MIIKFIVLVVSLFGMFLWGHYLGWKMGLKRRPSAEKLKTFSAEELSLLDDAVVDEIERRVKACIKERRGRTETFKSAHRSSANEDTASTEEGKVFEEFEKSEDGECKR